MFIASDYRRGDGASAPMWNFFHGEGRPASCVKRLSRAYLARGDRGSARACSRNIQGSSTLRRTGTLPRTCLGTPDPVWHLSVWAADGLMRRRVKLSSQRRFEAGVSPIWCHKSTMGHTKMACVGGIGAQSQCPQWRCGRWIQATRFVQKSARVAANASPLPFWPDQAPNAAKARAVMASTLPTPLMAL